MAAKTNPIKLLTGLVSRFKAHEPAYMHSSYNEDNTRAEFIDPLFTLLGWDIDNASGATEKFKDVERGPSLPSAHGHRTYAPDYAFRLAGQRKFFVEAKKPSVDIRSGRDPAFQLRKYVWNNSIPIGILTNFRDFAVYDCRYEPVNGDPATKGRRSIFGYDEFVAKWPELWNTFSKEALQLGRFDQFVELTPTYSRGIVRVDDSFLKSLGAYRLALAKEIASQNPSIDEAGLRFCVQALIDRIIFLRICEDRGIEGYESLLRISQNPTNVYKHLLNKFERAGNEYNSSLFRFRTALVTDEPPDTLSPTLRIRDKVLRQILESLYPPASPYDYALIPSDVLGQAYEQFLGEVVTLRGRGRVKLDKRPDVKHSAGIYYTPNAITRYMVQHTLGPLLEKASLADAAKIRVLDPACGSGSFLLAAFDYLLAWHLDQYIANQEKAARQKRIRRTASGEWVLTNDERKRILLNNLFGVDIDAQAVEVTKLSLLLKIIESETQDSILQQRKLFPVPMLPTLDANIRQGNSIICPEQLRAAGLRVADFEQLGPFSWKTEFPKIFSREGGGFTAILGNPPYVNAWELYETQPHLRDLINQAELFETAQRHWDLYILFIENALRLLAEGGRLAFIIPYAYAIEKYGEKSRELVLANTTLEALVDLRTVRVFGRVPTITIIPFLKKKKPAEKHRVIVYGPGPEATRYSPGVIRRRHSIPQKLWRSHRSKQWRLDITETIDALCRRVTRNSILLGDICHIDYGAQMSSKAKGAFGKKYVQRTHKASATCYPMVGGSDVYRYRAKWNGVFVEWKYAPQMYNARAEEWYRRPKLLIRDVTGTLRIECALDRQGLFSDHGNLIAQRACDTTDWRAITPIGSRLTFAKSVATSKHYSLDLLQGLICSKLISAFSYWQISGEGVRTGGGMHTYPEYARAIPVWDVSKSTRSQKVLIDRIETLSKQMSALQQKMIAEGHRDFDDRCTVIDEEIDNAVYQLYGLAADEVAAVNSAV
jgi:hypothetical protein